MKQGIGRIYLIKKSIFYNNGDIQKQNQTVLTYWAAGTTYTNPAKKTQDQRGKDPHFPLIF